MPFNGSGTYSRVYNWTTDKNNSINITASRMDTEDTGFATGLSTCLLKDGTQNPTANLPMNGFAHTGVANATLANQYAVVSQIQNSSYNWIAGGGTADAITATYAPAITTLVDGMELDFRATAANATATPTFSPNGLTAHTITQKGGSALVANNIPGANAEMKVRYNLANTRWELLNPSFVQSLPASNTITNAMLSQMAANSFKGNNTGSPANAADLTVAQAMTLLAAAPLASPTFTGTPAAPTASANTSTTQLATTAFANPAASLASPGYVKLPSGLILQWGSASIGASSNSVISLSVTYGTSHLVAFATMGSNTGTRFAPLASPTSTSQITVYNSDNSGTSTIYWLSIGY